MNYINLTTILYIKIKVQLLQALKSEIEATGKKSCKDGDIIISVDNKIKKEKEKEKEERKKIAEWQLPRTYEEVRIQNSTKNGTRVQVSRGVLSPSV